MGGSVAQHGEFPWQVKQLMWPFFFLYTELSDRHFKKNDFHLLKHLYTCTCMNMTSLEKLKKKKLKKRKSIENILVNLDSYSPTNL